MPTCYMLTVCSGSSVDQQSNNASLFNLVEYISVPPNAPPPPGGVIPLEIHAYWKIAPTELNTDFYVRFVMQATTGLETPSVTFKHRASNTRFRTRTLGLPFPPVADDYNLYVDWSSDSEGEWHRQSHSWPLSIRITEPKPLVTH